MAKLFFALPVDDLATELILWRDQRSWPGVLVPQENLHLTLAFLGEAEEAMVAPLIAAVNRQHCPPLSIPLDEVGWFSRARAAWIGPRQWPNELTVLANALQRHGERFGLGNGDQHYRPHITLSRKAPEPPVREPAPHFMFTVNRFCLYQSVSCPDGVCYIPRATWPLQRRSHDL